MAAQLTKENLDEFKKAFGLFLSIDSDHLITTKELGHLMRCIGLAPTELDLQDMINEGDLDGNGSIDFDEFLAIMLHKMKEPNKENEFRETFRVFDKEGIGYITIDAMRVVMTSLGEKLHEDEIEELMVLADADGDGRISYEDFVEAMSTH